MKTDCKNGNIESGKWNHFLIKQSNVHYNQILLSNGVTEYTLRTGERLQNIQNIAIYYRVEHLCFEVFSHCIKQVSSVRWRFQKCLLSVVASRGVRRIEFPSYRGVTFSAWFILSIRKPKLMFRGKANLYGYRNSVMLSIYLKIHSI